MPENRDRWRHSLTSNYSQLTREILPTNCEENTLIDESTRERRYKGLAGPKRINWRAINTSPNYSRWLARLYSLTLAPPPLSLRMNSSCLYTHMNSLGYTLHTVVCMCTRLSFCTDACRTTLYFYAIIFVLIVLMYNIRCWNILFKEKKTIPRWIFIIDWFSFTYMKAYF